MVMAVKGWQRLCLSVLETNLAARDAIFQSSGLQCLGHWLAELLVLKCIHIID